MKLVRDKIPEIIQASGKKPVTRTLDEAEFHKELVKKLQEEVTEFAEDPCLEELADVLEVIHALADLHGGLNNVNAERFKKAESRGAFKEKIFLEKIE